MRTTIFSNADGDVHTSIQEEFPWQPVAGGSLRKADLSEVPGGEMHAVEIPAGGDLAMHSSPHVAFCHIVRGSGKVGLPGDRELLFSGPEVLIFLPNTDHDFHAITEDTLLLVSVVHQG